jgi:hypothetical protein
MFQQGEDNLNDRELVNNSKEGGGVGVKQCSSVPKNGRQ